MFRSKFRHVDHTISRVDGTLIYGAKCHGCGWKVRHNPDEAAVDLACLEHSGRSGHGSFKLICTVQATVIRKG